MTYNLYLHILTPYLLKICDKCRRYGNSTSAGSGFENDKVAFITRFYTHCFSDCHVQIHTGLRIVTDHGN